MITPASSDTPKVRDSRTPEPPLPELTREVMAENGFLLPHYRSFTSIYNAASKMYSYRWDEAYKAGRENALAMRRDAYLQSLLQERLKPLRNWPVDIKLVNEKQANDESEQIRQTLLGIHAKTKFSGQQRYYLGNAIWYGRYASQVEYVKLPVDGMPRWCTPNHLPVNGDKIQVGWDGSYGVLINNTFRNDYPDIRVSDAGSAIMMLTRKDMRRRFIIHKYNIEDADFWEGDMAGRVGGIGLRDYCYWAWWLRDEMISWLVTFMEKAGSMGILLFYYQSGSAPAKAKAEQSAREVGGGNALAIPVPAGDPRVGSVELIAANTGGAQFLVDAISDWFERHIERLIVGQSMSGGKDSGDGLGGTGRAEFAKDTKFQLLLSDAKDLAETLTYDWLHQVQELNDLGWGKYEFRFDLCVPDPEAKDKLAAVQTATSFGVDFEKDEVRELTGLRKPRPGVDTVGGQQPGAGGIGPDGMPVPGGPGQPPADGATPGNQGNPTGEGAGLPHHEGGNEDDGDPAEGAGLPHPGEANVPPEVLAAMATLAERGDWAGVEELQQLASDPEGLQAFLEDDGEEPPANVEYAAVHYQWTAAQTKSGKVKAVWAGGGRAPLYGKRAEAALRAKDGKPAEAKPNTKQMLVDRKKAAEPGRETARQEWQRALTSGVNSEQLPQLVEHLHNLTRNELREMVRGLEQKVGGLKTDLVQRLVDHASSRPTPDQVDMGMGAMDQGKTGPLPRQREDRPDPAIAEAEARNAVDQGRKAKKKASMHESERTLTDIVRRKGGIRPDSYTIRQYFKNAKEAMEYGISMRIFNKSSRVGLDQIAQEMAIEGHIIVPEGNDPVPILMDGLMAKARSAQEDLTAKYDKAYEEHALALEEAYRESLAESDIEEAIRLGQIDGETEAAEDKFGIGDGTDEDFAFGNNASESAKTGSNTATGSVDLFGNPIPKSYSTKAGKQITMDDALREAWVNKAHEWAADNGTKVQSLTASGTFKAGGKEYQVGKAEDGYPISEVAPRPAESPKAPINPDTDLPGFAKAVQQLADTAPDEHTFFGTRAYIGDLYDRSQESPEFPKMSLEQFKRYLLMANNEGHIGMSRADLVQEMPEDKVMRSETQYINNQSGAEFHFVKAKKAPPPADAKAPSPTGIPVDNNQNSGNNTGVGNQSEAPKPEGKTMETTVTPPIPKAISSRWLEQQESKLAMTAKDGPYRGELETEINEAKAQKAKWDAFEGWVKKHLGAIRNNYRLRVGNEWHEPYKAFFRKDKTGMVKAWTIEDAWKEYLKSNQPDA